MGMHVCMRGRVYICMSVHLRMCLDVCVCGFRVGLRGRSGVFSKKTQLLSELLNTVNVALAVEIL